MKLLIVDDEDLTRRGLISSIDWASLNIKEVLEAENGKVGLEQCLTHKPEIVLTDVRMPRMDGILMVEEIRKLLPDTSIIFMSGYSDKEYLKAAIKFKAINYIEKPLDPLEIEEAVLEAIAQNKALKYTKQTQSLQSLELSNQVALQLTYPYTSESQVLTTSDEETGLDFTATTTFTCMIVKLTTPVSEIDLSLLSSIHASVDSLLHQFHLQEIHVAKYDQYIVYHLFGPTKPGIETLHKITKKVQSYYTNTFKKFFISIGNTAVGIENAYHSYSLAVFLLQSSFFYDYNSILTATEEPTSYNTLFTDPTAQFGTVLSQKKELAVNEMLSSIYNQFKNNQKLLPSQVKDVYYRLFMELKNVTRHHLTSTTPSFQLSDSIIDYVGKCDTLHELHSLLEEKTQLLFQSLDNYLPENPTIFAIKEFINSNYSNDNLSVKDISEHIFLSTTYVCTLFKGETGKTLNQYITEYRIEKAKQLLADPRYKISDISSKVGYSDGNYFGKSFKKSVGLSPSEYREKVLL